ncbi:hypothetical protein [Nostoc sp. FACHB-110]|uniref:hypothetical protein n=1 Tax=Nostoc sp. FACHB-110 TaxID=2692834 RepID=UPI001681E537|nr:hypothetical protein [Nostoc sp. FACHB-110]MBD2435372.1 hypothetical protein [Nostoc sp. FACHB-110]
MARVGVLKYKFSSFFPTPYTLLGKLLPRDRSLGRLLVTVSGIPFWNTEKRFTYIESQHLSKCRGKV